MPNRYAFRAVEHERSLAADVIIRSAFSATDGQFLLRYTSFSNHLPSTPWLAINHRGEYVDLLQFSPSSFQLFTQGRLVARLGSLELQNFESTSQGDVLSVAGTFEGQRSVGDISVSQVALISTSSTSLEFLYEVNAPPAVDEFRLTFSPVPGEPPTSVTETPDGLVLMFPERARKAPVLTIRPLGASTSASADESGTIQMIVKNSKVLQFEITFDESAPPLNEPGLFRPQDLLDQYRIQAIVLPADGALEQREKRLKELGFEPAGFAGSAAVLVRDAANFGRIGDGEHE
jgi:hypothetical protein